MSFQVSGLKERNFLDLLNDDFNPLELSNIKGSLWLQHFGYFNSLCARATRAIVNHAPIGEYRLKFFSREDFLCLCGLYPIKSQQYILYNCKRFNNYWNLRRDLSRSLMVDFILFSLFTLFYFTFLFPFNFLFLEQLGLGFISHAVTSVTN